MAGLPPVTSSTMPEEVDSFIDPVPSSPTGYLTTTDHAAEHDKENDALTVIEAMVYGVESPLNQPQGLAGLDVYGRIPISAMALNAALVAYGHAALVIPPAHATSGADVLTLTNRRLSGLGATTYAVTGSRLIDIFFDLIGGYGGAVSGATWSGPKPGVIILDAEKNDFYNPTSGSAWANLTNLQVTNWQNTLTAVLALLQSNTRIDSSSGTTTGTWTTVSGNFSGGSVQSTTAQNSTLTYPSVTIPPSGVLWHLGYVTTSPTGDSTFSISGTNVAAATSGASAGAAAVYSTRSGSINAPSTYMPQITQISGTPGASVQVEVTKTDSSTNPIYVDSLIVPQNTLPLVVVVYDNIGNNTNPVPSAPVSGWATQLTVAAVNKPLLDTAIGKVLVNFTNAVGVNLGTGLASSDLSYITGNDLNDRGMRKFSDLLSYAIGYWAFNNDSDALYTTL